ncbi:MAG: methylenetetrahydrofolate reductase [Candidatus Thorarchaeota archaeon]
MNEILDETHLKHQLEKGTFVVTGEIRPPKGSDRSLLDQRIKAISKSCDAINVPDNALASPTMSSIACSYYIIQNGAEPVMQLSSRNRTSVVITSELYGAYALGIRNALFISGDTPSKSDRSQNEPLDSIQALKLTNQMMSGFDQLGEELEGTPMFYLGATIDPLAEHTGNQIQKTMDKAEAGAKFFQTQAIYDIDRFADFMANLENLDAHVIAGIIPLRGTEMSQTLMDSIPGIKIPDAILERFDSVGDGLQNDEKYEAELEEGLRIAVEIVKDMRQISNLSGIHIMGLSWEESIHKIVQRAGLFPRPKRE